MNDHPVGAPCVIRDRRGEHAVRKRLRRLAAKAVELSQRRPLCAHTVQRIRTTGDHQKARRQRIEPVGDAPGKAKRKGLILLRERREEPPKDTVAARVGVGRKTRDARRLGHETKVGRLAEQHRPP